MLIYALMLVQAGDREFGGFSTHTLLQAGALYAPLVRVGEVWRMLTAVFIHLNPLHILMNMIALLQVGPLLERYYGQARFVLLYIVAGLGGSALSLAWHWNQPIVAAGASGAISGLILAGAVVSQLIGTVQARAVRNSMLIWAGVVLLYGTSGNVDNSAHLGGMITGAALAWGLGRRLALAPQPPAQGLGLESALLGLLVAGSFALAALNRTQAVSAGDLVNQGVDYSRADKPAEALPLYQRAVTLEPANAVAQFDLALTLLRLNRFPEAAAAGERAAALDPQNATAFIAWADALEQQGKTAEAAAVRARAPVTTPTPNGH